MYPVSRISLAGGSQHRNDTIHRLLEPGPLEMATLIWLVLSLQLGAYFLLERLPPSWTSVLPSMGFLKRY